MRPARAIVVLALASLLIAGCNLRPSEDRPTVTAIFVVATDAPSPQPPATMTPPPMISPDRPVPTLEIARPSDSPIPPTAPASPTATPLYFEYVVKDDDTLMGIIQVFGYGYQLEVAEEVVALNRSMSSIDFVPVGQTILIPRPTATFTPVGAEATAETLASIGIDSDTGLTTGSTVGCHKVVANETMVSIAERYNTTLEILSDLNSQLNWSGCNFTLLAGGEECVPILNIGACINVPQPTPIPTRFPTPTGRESPTPTATKLAPRLLYPADGAIISSRDLMLEWVGLSGLGEDDVYLVELIDQTSLRDHRQRTRANSYRAPASLAPTDGRDHSMQWRVTVARQNPQGLYYYVGEQGEWRRFQWLSG